MRNSSIGRYVVLMPLFYSVYTRFNGLKGFVNNLLTAWLPSAFIVLHERNFENPAWDVLLYILSYLVFISVYEIGYIYNDNIAALHEDKPSVRPKFESANAVYILFVAIRLGVFLVGLIVFDIYRTPESAIPYGCLIVVIVLHNTLSSVVYKFFTFIQMSLFRYVIPIATVLGTGSHADIYLIALTYFTLPRFLRYQVTKSRLDLPEWASGRFLAMAYLLMLPLGLALGFGNHTYLFLYVAAYYLVIYGSYFAASQARAPRTNG